MRYTPHIYQNTEPRSGLSKDADDVLMNATGDIIAGLSVTGEWVAAEES